MSETHPAREFITNHTKKLIPLSKELGETWWQLNQTGDKKLAELVAALDAKHTKMHADPDEFAQLRAWCDDGIDDPLLLRQVELLYLAYLANQKDEETIQKISDLETGLELDYSTFRGVFEGKKTSDNDLKTVLVEDTDSDRRQAAWEASKQVGGQVAQKVLELVRLRNGAAQKQGFGDYYRMSLEAQEIGYDDLFSLLDELEQLTREPFAKAKSRLDTYLKRRFGTEDLRPWHYSDFFFQEAPPNDDVALDPFFKERDPVQLAVDTYDRIGLDVRAILQRSDLYPRENKHQHAFCTSIDREKDVRILCNVKNDEGWTSTMLHELGHAVYDYYLDDMLPFLLREPAHMLSTEAVAMLMDRLTKSPFWLTEVAGIPESDLGGVMSHLDEYESLSKLIFVRWCLVMIYFERDMYADPERDLNTLWWDYVEKFQMVRRPDGRNAPDWAAKMHIAVAPVYYHNYLMGDMMASQLQDCIVERIHKDGASGGKDVGEFLQSRLFSLGARYPWNDTLEKVTGEPLTARHFAGQFVR